MNLHPQPHWLLVGTKCIAFVLMFLVEVFICFGDNELSNLLLEVFKLFAGLDLFIGKDVTSYFRIEDNSVLSPFVKKNTTDLKTYINVTTTSSLT